MNSLKRIYAPLIEGQTYREVLYLILGFPVGITLFAVLLTLYTLGIATIVVWVGVFILVATQALLRPIGAFERRLMRWLLGRVVPAPAPLVVEPARDATHPGWSNFGRRSYALLHDAHAWRVLAWSVARMITGPVGFVVAVIFPVVSFSLLIGPVGTLDLAGVDPHRWDWALWFGPLAFLIVAPALAWSVRWIADFHRWLGQQLLGPCGDEIRAVALARASKAEEQIRIDQELHDSIGHMVSMIVVQAGAGAHVFDKDPEFARRALRNIEERGRAALGELDRLIAKIRGDKPETLAPLPGAIDIPALIDGARDAGVEVTDHVDLGAVPPALGRGIYRVIQEALTNAAKHAPGAKVVVSAVSDGQVVAVSVTNAPSRAVASASFGGNGLASITDRVALMGGRATVGRMSDGGFAVKAIVPLGDMLPDGRKRTCSLTERCRCPVCLLTRRSDR